LFANWDQAFNNWLDKDAEWNRSPREATANGGFVGVPDSPAFDAGKHTQPPIPATRNAVRLSVCLRTTN
jgi:hypothetical protein